MCPGACPSPHACMHARTARRCPSSCDRLVPRMATKMGAALAKYSDGSQFSRPGGSASVSRLAGLANLQRQRSREEGLGGASAQAEGTHAGSGGAQRLGTLHAQTRTPTRNTPTHAPTRMGAHTHSHAHAHALTHAQHTHTHASLCKCKHTQTRPHAPQAGIPTTPASPWAAW